MIKIKPKPRKITVAPKPFDAEKLAHYIRRVAAHGGHTKIHITPLKEGGFSVAVSCQKDNDGSWNVQSGRNPLDPLLAALDSKMLLMRLRDK